MKRKVLIIAGTTILLLLFITKAATANINYGTTVISDKPADVRFIAFFSDDDEEILTEETNGSGYDNSTNQWHFDDFSFNQKPEVKENGYIWLYNNDDGSCYTDKQKVTGEPVDWGKAHPTGTNIQSPELTAVSVEPGIIMLYWTDVQKAETYTIYRSQASKGPYIRVAEDITVTEYMDSGLNYQNYCYIVVGKHTSGKFGGHSSEAVADASLAVELASFTAWIDNSNVTLKWETASEVGNIGFYVYRAEKQEGPFEKISPFIEGAGNSALGRDYEYIDKDVELNKTYFYCLEDIDIIGENGRSEIVKAVVSLPSLKEKPLPIPVPKESHLFQNYPNPFNAETWVPFQMAKASEVSIYIYNPTGQVVKTINLGYKQPGMYIEKSKAAYWDGRNDRGEKTATGQYFYELRTGKFRAVKRMILLK